LVTKCLWWWLAKWFKILSENNFWQIKLILKLYVAFISPYVSNSMNDLNQLFKPDEASIDGNKILLNMRLVLVNKIRSKIHWEKNSMWCYNTKLKYCYTTSENIRRARKQTFFLLRKMNLQCTGSWSKQHFFLHYLNGVNNIYSVVN
jgi:hypothetical protein